MTGPPSSPTEGDEALGVEKRVGIAFETARVPSKIDQQPIEDLLGLGPGGQVSAFRGADLPELAALLGREIGADVRAVRGEKLPPVSDWLSGREWFADLGPDLETALRQRDRRRKLIAHGARLRSAFGGPGHDIFRPSALAASDETPFVHEKLEPVLQRALRSLGLQRPRNRAGAIRRFW